MRRLVFFVAFALSTHASALADVAHEVTFSTSLEGVTRFTYRDSANVVYTAFVTASHPQTVLFPDTVTSVSVTRIVWYYDPSTGASTQLGAYGASPFTLTYSPTVRRFGVTLLDQVGSLGASSLPGASPYAGSLSTVSGVDSIHVLLGLALSVFFVFALRAGVRDGYAR